MNAYINYFAYSYLKNNVNSINNCIQSYLEDGNTEKCENEVVAPWLGEFGASVFSNAPKKETKIFPPYFNKGLWKTSDGKFLTGTNTGFKSTLGATPILWIELPDGVKYSPTVSFNP